MPGRAAATRLAAARTAPALACLLAPAAVLRSLGAPGDRVAIVRLLGVREVTQAAAIVAVPGVMRAGAAVDALHALSMVGLAALDRRYRRAGLVAAAAATGWSVAGALAGTGRAPRATVVV